MPPFKHRVVDPDPWIHFSWIRTLWLIGEITVYKALPNYQRSLLDGCPGALRGSRASMLCLFGTAVSYVITDFFFMFKFRLKNNKLSYIICKHGYYLDFLN